MPDQIPNALASAVNARALYPANHPRVLLSVATLLAAVESTLKEMHSDNARTPPFIAAEQRLSSPYLSTDVLNPGNDECRNKFLTNLVDAL